MSTTTQQIPLKATVWVCLVASCLMTGCASKVGSNMMEVSHSNYNHAIADIQRDELLLNVVRRRYLEPPQFTSVGSISQSRSVTKTGSAVLNIATPKTGSLTATGSVVELPTYSLTPQAGPAAARALHSQVPIDVIPHLTSAGYSLDMVFTLLAREVSGIRGVDVCAGGMFEGGSTEYMAMLSALKCLEANDDVAISNAIWEEKLFEHPFAPEVFSPDDVASVQDGLHSYTSTDEGQSFFVTGRSPQPVLWLSSKARYSGKGKDLLRLLNLNPDQKKKGWALRNQKFVQGVEFADIARGDQDHVTIQTRSIYGVLNMLAQGVCVPPCDGAALSPCLEKYTDAIKCGRAPDIASSFKVCYSENCPKSAFVAVKYRCGWYYIDDCDLCSKTYFNALHDLYNLAGPERIESGNGGRITSPVLTLAR